MGLRRVTLDDNCKQLTNLTVHVAAARWLPKWPALSAIYRPAILGDCHYLLDSSKGQQGKGGVVCSAFWRRTQRQPVVIRRLYMVIYSRHVIGLEEITSDFPVYSHCKQWLHPFQSSPCLLTPLI